MLFLVRQVKGAMSAQRENGSSGLPSGILSFFIILFIVPVCFLKNSIGKRPCQDCSKIEVPFIFPLTSPACCDMITAEK